MPQPNPWPDDPARQQPDAKGRPPAGNLDRSLSDSVAEGDQAGAHRNTASNDPAAGPALQAGFDFTAQTRTLCGHVTSTQVEFSHIDLDRVALSFAQSRKPVLHGLQASLTPLRFEGGAEQGTVRGRRYRVQPVFDRRGREMLYVLNFYLPRFMQLEFREKLVTVFHELWHISPDFDGDLRRHPGRCYAHSHSQADYDRQMGLLVDAWLQTEPPESLLGYLRLDFTELQRRYGRVYGVRIPRPKLLPV